MEFYYNDIIELDELRIDSDTCVYLVQGNDAEEFSLKAIKKAYLNKILLDPTTRCRQYWPLQASCLLALENNQEALTNLFYRANDSQRLILSNRLFTRAELHYLLKINPVHDCFDKYHSKHDAGVTNIQSIYFASYDQPISNVHLLLSVKKELRSEIIALINRVNGFLINAHIVYYSESHQQLSKFLLALAFFKSIKTECYNLEQKIHQLIADSCYYNTLYPEPIDELAINSLVASHRLCQKVSQRHDTLELLFLEDEANNTPQPKNQEVTTGYGAYMNTLATQCITFFKQVMPAMPPNEPPAYPYNRTRVFL